MQDKPSIPLVCALVLAAAGACGGASADETTLPEPPPPVTRATLAGPLCQGNQCECKGPDADPGVAGAEGVKRYEFVLGPTDNELWAKVGEMVLYKGVERATECFYLDLPSPGEHPVTLRARGDEGYGARLTIHELGPGKGWYDTFEFVCGGPGVCTIEQLDEFRSSLDRYERNIHDPCGSTKIQGLSWKTGRMADLRVPSELLLRLTLKLYEFEPEHPPGHASCKDNY